MSEGEFIGYRISYADSTGTILAVTGHVPRITVLARGGRQLVFEAYGPTHVKAGSDARSEACADLNPLHGAFHMGLQIISIRMPWMLFRKTFD